MYHASASFEVFRDKTQFAECGRSPSAKSTKEKIGETSLIAQNHMLKMALILNSLLQNNQMFVHSQ